MPGPWSRWLETTLNFRLHFGDLSENHNLLHLALRYLLGQYWPDRPLIDGRTASTHRREAGEQILAWLDRWEFEGSTEWGSGIYYNVNFLALLNLIDFAQESDVRNCSCRVMDLFMLDQALHSFAGAAVGAAHRDYAVYRMDAFESPSRPIQYLMFGIDRPPMYNLNFIGGAIQAACSEYRPPAELVELASNGRAHRTIITHTLLAGLWRREDDRINTPPCDRCLQGHACRLDGAMLGVMNSYPTHGRYTEFVLQITLDEQAISFVNHPSADQPHRLIEPAELRVRYDQGEPPRVPMDREDRPWYWCYANVPPGNEGDMRPGYWQGHMDGPRSYGHGRVGACLYDIKPDASFPFAHVYCPRRRFDVAEMIGPWLLLRKGDGYAAWWFSTPARWVTQGTWADAELGSVGKPSPSSGS